MNNYFLSGIIRLTEKCKEKHFFEFKVRLTPLIPQKRY